MVIHFFLQNGRVVTHFADGLLGRCLRGQEQVASARQRFQFKQQFMCGVADRNSMRAAHLHPLDRDMSDTVRKIELVPTGFPQLAR